MKKHIGYSDFQREIVTTSELYNLAGCPPILVEQNAHGWSQNSTLNIFYPNYVTLAEDGSPLIGGSFEFDADDALNFLPERLQNNLLFIGIKAYVGVFTAGKTDSDPARFEVCPQKTARHIMLDFSAFDDIFLLDEEELEQFCAEYHAVYRCAGSSLHQLIILPIEGDIAELAVGCILAHQVNETVADILREIHSERQSGRDDHRSAGCLAYEHLKSRIDDIVANQQDICCDWDEGTEICIFGPQKALDVEDVYRLNIKDGLRDLVGAIVGYESRTHPLTDFYGQPTP